MMEQEHLEQKEQEELFLLDSLNLDRVFHSIQRTDYLFLYYIQRCGSRNNGTPRAYLYQLSEEMGLSIPTLSRSIEGLQDKGYVLWKTDQALGRTYVELTSKAVELMHEERMRLQQCSARVRQEIGEEELTSALRTLKKVAKVLARVSRELEEDSEG